MGEPPPAKTTGAVHVLLPLLNLVRSLVLYVGVRPFTSIPEVMLAHPSGDLRLCPFRGGNRPFNLFCIRAYTPAIVCVTLYPPVYLLKDLGWRGLPSCLRQIRKYIANVMFNRVAVGGKRSLVRGYGCSTALQLEVFWWHKRYTYLKIKLRRGEVSPLSPETTEW